MATASGKPPANLLFLLLGLLAISPHTLSLEQVLRQADWVAVAGVLSVEPINGKNGSGLRFDLQMERTLWGKPPAVASGMLYWEAWPVQAPDGKVEAPLWTGSTLERKLKPGDRFLAIASGTSLERAELLEKEQEVRRLKP